MKSIPFPPLTLNWNVPKGLTSLLVVSAKLIESVKNVSSRHEAFTSCCFSLATLGGLFLVPMTDETSNKVATWSNASLFSILNTIQGVQTISLVIDKSLPFNFETVVTDMT
jgi:hypothetical protein